MMTPEERFSTIHKRLNEAFKPTHLEIIDDGAKHHGHASNRGAGYYTVVITANDFQGLSRVEVHRKIYQELADLIPNEIHALQIKILSPIS